MVETMKLISMTDFVLEQNRKLWQYADKDDKIQSLERINLYADFLSQPLTLGMFVPCDENNNVLPDVNQFLSCEKDIKYRGAKERVLFDGFELKGKHLWNKDKLFMISDNYNESFANQKNIEWLISQSVHEFILTESAKQQIGW